MKNDARTKPRRQINWLWPWMIPLPLLSSRPERRIRPRIPRCNSRGIDPLRVYSDVAPAVSRSAGNVAQQVNCRAPAALSPSPLPPIRSPNSRRWFARPIFPAVESRRFAFSRRSDADTRRLTSLSSPLLSFSVGEFALRLRARLKKRRGGGGGRGKRILLFWRDVKIERKVLLISWDDSWGCSFDQREFDGVGFCFFFFFFCLDGIVEKCSFEKCALHVRCLLKRKYRCCCVSRERYFDPRVVSIRRYIDRSLFPEWLNGEWDRIVRIVGLFPSIF